MTACRSFSTPFNWWCRRQREKAISLKAFWVQTVSVRAWRNRWLLLPGSSAELLLVGAWCVCQQRDIYIWDYFMATHQARRGGCERPVPLPFLQSLHSWKRWYLWHIPSFGAWQNTSTARWWSIYIYGVQRDSSRNSCRKKNLIAQKCIKHILRKGLVWIL